MNRLIRRFPGRFALAGVLMSLAIGASAAPLFAADSTPASGKAVERVALIAPASRTDQGWNQQATQHISQVGEELGFEVEIAENAGYDDITPILRDIADDGVDLIICHASGYQTVCPEFAAETGTRVAVIENPNAVEAGLISDIETQAQEVAYLAGIVAGMTTRTGTVGIVVSGEPPTWNFMSVGFAEGLHAVRPDTTLLYSVIGEGAYEDAAGAKRVTESQLAAGADIIFGMGDGASFGMIQAIEEFNADAADNERAHFIDVIGDKSETDAREVLLTSVLFDYTGIYTEMVEDIGRGEFGKVYTMDVANEGVRLLELPDDLDEKIREAVEEARQEIIDGTIEVSAVGDAGDMQERLDELFPRDG